MTIKDVQKDLLDPAVLGTTGILKSIEAFAPTVKRVVVTSSFAAIVNRKMGFWPEHTYSEADWNPTTHEEALADASYGYFGSKTFAEQAAWKFVEDKKPNFTLTTIQPPMIYGPMKQHVKSLDDINTSSIRMRDFLLGKFKNEIPATALPLWVDVRDVALVHTLAMESEEVAGQRVLTTAGYFNNREMMEIVRKHFPEYAERLPAEDLKGGELPEGGVYKFDNSRVRKLLKQDFITFEQSMVDLVKTLKELGA
jgi:nucleoside-diphosphate-sugar epimerase